MAKTRTASAPRSAPAWFVVFIVTAAQTAIAMSNIVLPTIAPKLAESLGVSPVLIGYQVSLTFGAATAASIYGGQVAMRWGAALTTQVSMALCAIGTALFALPHTGFIAAGSVAIGAAMGFASPAAAHLLVEYTAPGRRNLMFSIKQTGVPVGGVVIALTAPALAVSVGWRWSLVPVVALSVAALLLTQPYRKAWDRDRDPAPARRRESFGGVPLVWREKSLRWISLASVLFSGIQRCLLTFMVIYLVAEGGYGLVEAGIMLSITQIGGSVARVPWGWLADRLESGLVVMIVISGIIIVSSVALVALGPDWPRSLVYLLFFVLGASAVGWNGVFHGECARLSPPGTVSLVAGATAFFVFGGVLIAPAAFAAAYEVIGTYSETFKLVVVAGVATLGLLVLARRADVAHRAAP